MKFERGAPFGIMLRWVCRIVGLGAGMVGVLISCLVASLVVSPVASLMGGDLAQAQTQAQVPIQAHGNATTLAPSPDRSSGAMQPIGAFEIDRTEVTIGAFRAFVKATGTRTKAERDGGGLTYEAGWEKRPGWLWHSPYGSPGADDEPTVHVTQFEAQAYCRWAGKRLPTEAEWREAAYTERRTAPPAPFVQGRTYAYPTGDSPQGANCLGDCGTTAKPVAHAVTSRGKGHAPVGTTVAGVNGLHDMGANAWEWVDGGPGGEQPTLGGSWWYGASPMHREHRATKPADMAVVYIGFRCARSR